MRLFKLIVLLLGLVLFNFKLNAQTTFNKGVNLTGWFQTSNSHQIQLTKYTKRDFENIKSLGCDVIRLPINLFYMAGGQPEYKLDTLFLQFLDQAVNWAEETQIHLIIDNHSTDDIASRNPALESIITKVWKQMADHYKNRSEYIVYEIMNEPNGITTQVWGNIQQKAIDAIRSVDATHTIIVGASGYNTYKELNLLPQYTDSKLIYTFHFYDPFIFTHQGASWPSPSMANLKNVPYPYLAGSMPALPSELIGTWIQNSYNNYNVEGTQNKIKELIDIAVAFKSARNANLYCGEFGVYIPNSPNNDRVLWYNHVRSYLEEKGISWTTWDYQGTFGLFEKGTNELFDYDINIPLIQALGLVNPEQKVLQIVSDSVGLNIYTDYIGENIIESSNAIGGFIDFYSDKKPNNEKYCISWTGSARYSTIGFNFVPDKNFSRLNAENYALSFLVRGNSPGTNIEIRFIDSKTIDPNDHPWRMNYTISDNIAQWDGRWHKVYIPLSNFIDQGSWDNNTWYNPIGAFDWKAVDKLEIVTDQGSLQNKTFWFDNICISNMDTAQVFENSIYLSAKNDLSTQTESLTNCYIYPNPASEKATITYSLKDQANVEISIYNLSGQKVKSMLNRKQSAGDYKLDWNLKNEDGFKVNEGLYLCRISISNKMITSKILVSKGQN
jgi:endoglucanase